MRKFLVVILFSISISCVDDKTADEKVNVENKNEIEIMIENNSDDLIQDIELEIREIEKKLVFEKIKPNDKLTEKIIMDDETSDVSYIITFNQNEMHQMYISKFYSKGELNGHYADFKINDKTVDIQFNKSK